MFALWNELMRMDIGIVKAVVCGGFLLIEGIRDFRRREISVISCAAAMIIGILIRLCGGDLSWFDFLASLAVGGFLLLLSFLSNESIGYGDGLVMLAVGVLLGGAVAVKLLCFALFLCGIFSGILFLFRKAGRKSRIPFVVFLVPSYCVLIFAEVLGNR